MAETISWCIMKVAFYISLSIYSYFNYLNGDTDMKLISFQSTVLLGILALLNRR